MFEKAKTKIAGIVLPVAGVAIAYGTQIHQAKAVVIGTGGVSLESTDLDSLDKAAKYGISTQFESLKLLGVTVMIASATWLINKAFNAPLKAFGGQA